jgi:hypothetical protein
VVCKVADPVVCRRPERLVIPERGSSREESAVSPPAANRFLAGEPGVGMTRRMGLVFGVNGSDIGFSDVLFVGPKGLSFRSAVSSREESAVSLPAASRFLAGEPGLGMTRRIVWRKPSHHWPFRYLDLNSERE